MKIDTFMQIGNSFPVPGPGLIPCLEVIFYACTSEVFVVLKASCALDAAVYFFLYG